MTVFADMSDGDMEFYAREEWNDLVGQAKDLLDASPDLGISDLVNTLHVYEDVAYDLIAEIQGDYVARQKREQAYYNRYKG